MKTPGAYIYCVWANDKRALYLPLSSKVGLAVLR